MAENENKLKNNKLVERDLMDKFENVKHLIQKEKENFKRLSEKRQEKYESKISCLKGRLEKKSKEVEFMDKVLENYKSTVKTLPEVQGTCSTQDNVITGLYRRIENIKTIGNT